MTWKDILKIEMEEARRLGRKYASEEMLRDDTDKMVRRQKETIPRLELLISIMRDEKTNRLSSKELSAIDFMLKEFKMSPPQIKNNMERKEVIEILEKYISDVKRAHRRHGY